MAAAVLVTAASGLSVSPAMAAGEAAAPCDPALASGLAWSAPSFLAWGRDARRRERGGFRRRPGLRRRLGRARRRCGQGHRILEPVDSDLEFVLQAPAKGDAITASASWALVDETETMRCGQAAALNVPLGAGKTLRYQTKLQKNGVAWSAIGAGDCHDVALEPVSLTVQQGGVTRRLTASDQCNPSGAKRVSTKDWELVLKNGGFALRALTTHSSLKTRLRFAVRVGPRRVASGSLSLVRVYRPVRLIVVSDPAFQRSASTASIR